MGEKKPIKKDDEIVSPKPIYPQLLFTPDAATDATEDETAKIQFSRGLHYYNGDGEQKDFKKAAACFQSAAENGHADGYAYLGLCYKYGRGVKQSLPLAKQYLEMAVKKGSRIGEGFLEVMQTVEESARKVTKSKMTSIK